MFEGIISAPLNKPPRGADRLSSKGNLLIAWTWPGFVTTENGAEYHFATHSPAEGWHGYCWNEEYGEPKIILPVTQDTAWVYTDADYLMSLWISQSDNAAITARVKIDRSCFLLDASDNDCLLRRESKIIRLRLDRDKGQLSEDDLYAGAEPVYARFLSDGAIAIFDRILRRLFVLSPEDNRLHEEKVPDYVDYYYFGRFIVVRDRNNDLYYTDDPRKGWAKSGVLKVHSRLRNNHAIPHFITILGDEGYIALCSYVKGCYNTYLYRCPLESPERIKYAWGIRTGVMNGGFALYNRLICVTYQTRIHGIGGTRIPDNDDFLAWDPIHNTFHTDIPRSTTNIQKISSGRIPSISIPEIWEQNEPHRQKI